MKNNTFLSLVPFGIFVVAAIGLSLVEAVDINLLIGVGIIAIIIGAILAEDKDEYWNVIFEFFGSKTATTATLLWLMVGVYGCILKEGHIVEGLVWAAGKINMGSTAFTVVVFLFSGLFAISTGSGFGTISAMSLTLFPAGIALGAHPALLGGAILSGASLGDSIAPVSDTAVIAASTQEYEDAGKVADVGGTVKDRLPFVLVVVFITILAFIIVGSIADNTATATDVNTTDTYPQGLALLIPTFVVILLSLRHVNIFISIFAGIILAVVIGYILDLFTLDDIVSINNDGISGSVADGISGMASICILLMVVVSLSGVIIRSGCMERIIEWMNVKFIHSAQSAELAIFTLVSLAGILIAAVNTIANICIAPFVNSIGRQHHLHPYRRATLLATIICTFPFILPYGGCVLLLRKGIEASACGVNIQATDVFLTAFYPWVLFVVMFIMIKKQNYERINKTDI